jgi:hypothetical protein
MSALSEIMRYGREMELESLREYKEKMEERIQYNRSREHQVSDALMKFHNLKIILEQELDKETLDRIYRRLNKND